MKLLKSTTIRITLLGFLLGLLFPVFSTIFELRSRGMGLNPGNILTIQMDSALLLVIDTAPFVIGLLSFFIGNRQDKLSQANKSMEDQIKEALQENKELNQQNLEQLQTYTRSLERRAIFVEAAADVGKTATSVVNLDEMLNQVVTMISERFDFYHVGIFFVDDRNEYADWPDAESPNQRHLYSILL